MIVSQRRTSLDRNLWQLSRVIFTACLPWHCQVEQNPPVLRKDSAGSETENQ